MYRWRSIWPKIILHKNFLHENFLDDIKANYGSALYMNAFYFGGYINHVTIKQTKVFLFCVGGY